MWNHFRTNGICYIPLEEIARALGSELSRTGREPSASRLYEGKTIAKLKDVERILVSNNMLYLGVEQFTSLTYESIDDRDREFYQLK